MVVRLGQTSGVEVVNSQRYRIKQGQALSMSSLASVIKTIRAWARVRYDNGEDGILFIPDELTSNDRTSVLSTPSDVARMDGWVVDALVELPVDTDVKRGQLYIKLFMDPFGPVLCTDYLYSRFGQVALGTYIQAGPGGGAGNLEVLTLKAEGVPLASTSWILAQYSSEIVKIYGFAWYYLASADAASRVLSTELRQPRGAMPTGQTVASVWEIPDLTLIANQQGIVFADEKRSGINDHTALAIDSAATNPSPFPILVTEGDPYFVNFSVASLHANDLDTIYLFQESWITELS